MPTQQELFYHGKERVELFCEKNSIPPPAILLVPRAQWRVNACGYYRSNTIRVCVERCARPAIDSQYKQWSHPGSTIDREPYGVVCHEAGHYLDHIMGKVKGKYSSEFSSLLRKQSKEPKLTNYCPNDSEWFAEMVRLYLTNAALLKLVRPVTYSLLCSYYQPVSSPSWEEEIKRLATPPARIVASQKKKFAVV